MVDERDSTRPEGADFAGGAREENTRHLHASGHLEADIPEAPEAAVFFLFDKLRSSLLRYALSFGLAPQDCEDVIQETYLALFRHLQANKSRQNLHAWLYRVAHNLALKRRDANRKLGHVSDMPFLIQQLDPSVDIEEHAIFRQEQKKILAIFCALSERERQCIQLRSDGLNYREISRILGISLGSVAAAMAKSLQRMSQTQIRSGRPEGIQPEPPRLKPGAGRDSSAGELRDDPIPT
ncbi:MAG TPA: RNA polymerase sigma factor [Candidatus Angelobacter sp.]|nr:RNA polymerase sigma factor [Candidatus Angelobacter sp.]